MTAALSYRFYETPILRLKDQFAVVHTSVPRVGSPSRDGRSPS